MELKEAVLNLRDFLTPLSRLDQVGLNEISISSILTNVLDNFLSKHEQFSNEIQIELEKNQDEDQFDVFWKFSLCCLYIIKNLNESKFEINPNGCYLSINDERLVQSCCQLIACFGIHYNLEDNVGVSIEKLSKYGVNITKKRDIISPLVRNRRLARCLNFLLGFKSIKREHVDIVFGIFYRKYMHDILSSLIQLCYSSNSKITEIEKNEFLKWLNEDIFDEADGSVIVSSLIISQGNIRNKAVDWFLVIIGRLLTKCLMRPNSVMNVIRAVLNEMNAVSNVTLASDWKKCDIVAKILTQCPHNINQEEYIKFIAPQVINLFFNIDQRYARHFYRVAGSVYSLFAQRYPVFTRMYFTNKILEQFDTNLNAKEFRSKLTNLHLVFVTSTEPNWQTLSQLSKKVIYLVFDSYVLLKPKYLAKDTCNLCEEILKLYFKMMPNNNQEVLKYLIELLKFSLIKNEQMDLIWNKNNLQLDNFDDSSEEECVLSDKIETKDVEVTLAMVENRSKIMLELIKKIDDKNLEIQFMIYLFEQISTYYETTTHKKDKNTQEGSDRSLLELEENLVKTEFEINSKIIFFTQLSLLFETIDPQLMIDSHEKIINFCRLILKSIIILVSKENFIVNIEQESEYQTIHLILSIISVYTTGLIEIDYQVKQTLQVLLPLLNELKYLYQQTEIENMADSLYISIGTYCGIKSAKNNEIKKNRILIEEVDSEMDDYDKSINDLKDPLIPVRAHGLVMLRKLIESKNEKCLKNTDFLIEQFIKELKSEDSYLYLASINALISLTDYDPNKILDILIKEYLDMKNKLDLETRLKIGEVLTKSIRLFNELVPKYGPKLINVFLIGTKHDDEFFRSSCLSNMGETCKLLNYSINQNIYEIINCLSCLIDTDKSIQVKRSAILALKMIIEGLKKENFIQVLDSSIVPLYKLLTKTMKVVQDDVIQLNCQLTNEYLKELMKSSMFPNQTFQKEIKVLSPF